MRASGSERQMPSAEIHSYRNLDFYQLARSLAVDVYKISRRFPKDDSTRVATRQLVASVTSIRANIAEGHGRYSKSAYRNHLSIARGSATETEDWIDFLVSIDLLNEEEGRVLSRRCQQIIASLTRAMRRLSNDLGQANQIGEEPPPYLTEDEFDILDKGIE